jgi:type II secretory pathway pseudopilin PulG
VFRISDLGYRISERLKVGASTKSAIRNPRSKRRGFTLVEAIAATALVGLGVATTLGGMAVLAKGDRELLEREQMQRLAVRKYQEIVSTGMIDTADLKGDFTEENIEDYEWNATVEPSGEENLEVLTVTVNRTGASEEDPAATVDGLVFNPPIQGGAAGAP